MLSQYFGFVESPFGVTPDPRFLFLSRTHREALASLQYAFYSDRGFTALIAPPGMGKTTLLFEFLRRVQDKARTAFLFNSHPDAMDLLKALLREIGLVPADTIGQMVDQLNNELVGVARGGRRFVIVVDEAQSLSETTLETLRLLTNFETPRQKLMHIVLSGQPQLADKLFSPNLVQLRQRVSTFCKLSPFSREDTISYINHRLKISGYTGSSLFTPGSLTRIAEASEGIPRLVNTLCFNSLSLCHALGRTQVDADMVNEAIDDLHPPCSSIEHKTELATDERDDREQEILRVRRPMRAWVAAVALLLVIGCIGTFGALRLHVNGPSQYNRPQAIQQPPIFPHPVIDTVPSSADPRPLSTIPIEVTVGPQQTLSAISVNEFGGYDPDLLRTIQKLNPTITDPNLIHPGQKILLPRHATPHVRTDPSSGPGPEEQP